MKILLFAVLFGLSLHATNGVLFKNPTLRNVGIAILVLSALGVGGTAIGIDAWCSAGRDQCQKLYWNIVPGFIVIAAGGVVTILGSMCRSCPGEQDPSYIEIQ